MYALIKKLGPNEAETAEMCQHPFMRLGLEHENDSRFACGCVLKCKLISEGGFPRSRSSGNEISITCEQTPIQQPVEPGNTRSDSGMFGVPRHADDSIRHANLSTAACTAR